MIITRGQWASRAVEAGVAAFAAAAVAFAGWAMPPELFERLVSTTGIGALIPAAQPPLGETARLIVCAGAAGIVFLPLFFGLRLLGRPRSAWRELPPKPRAAAPRVRRADAHPDAPFRAPISANLELGTPMPPPWPEAPPPADPEPDLPELTLEDSAQPAEQPAEEPEPFRAPVGNHSVADLISRLEEGLARRGHPVPPPAAIPRPVEEQPPETPASQPLDDRLRAAIDDLQRLTARG